MFWRSLNKIIIIIIIIHWRGGHNRFKPSIEIVDLVLAFVSYRMLFVNFENGPYSF